MMGIVDDVEWEDSGAIDLMEYDESDWDYTDRVRVKSIRRARKAWRDAESV